MKKLKVRSKIVFATVVIVIFSAVGLASNTEAVRVTKSYRYDWNYVLDSYSNYHNYQYTDIPNNYKYTGHTRYQVGGGWNYIRYERLNYYGK